MEVNKIYNTDCIEGMKSLDPNSIACCITDPPYNYEFIGKDWNIEEIKRRTKRVKNSNTLVKNIPYGSGLSGGIRNKRWYEKNRENILNYEKWVEKWGDELFRILKPGGFVFVFNSTRTIAHVQVALENVGFYARDIIVWMRNSGIPKGLNMTVKLKKMGVENPEQWKGWHSALRNEWEAICVLQKPLKNNYYETIVNYNIGLLNVKDEYGFKSNIIKNIKQEKKDDFNTHCTIKPKELIKYLINLSVPKHIENIVIDPFMGSGTLAVACKELGVNYIGYEINKEYIEIAEKRLKNVIR
jgi:DNA modification methylase